MPECGIMRYCWSLIVLSITTVVLLVLFIVFAMRDSTRGSCELTYAGNGAVTEEMMLKWTMHEDWPLARPTFDKQRQSCVCADAHLDPTYIPMVAPVVVWIAPGDLVSLYRQGELRSLPHGFVAAHTGDYATKDHVKVCLEHRHLVQLWGSNATNTHCHKPVDGIQKVGLQRFFLGYDGALFCASGTDTLLPPSPPPPSPPPAPPPSPPPSPPPLVVPNCFNLPADGDTIRFPQGSEHLCELSGSSGSVQGVASSGHCTYNYDGDGDGELDAYCDEKVSFTIFNDLSYYSESFTSRTCPGNTCPFYVQLDDESTAITCQRVSYSSKQYKNRDKTPDQLKVSGTVHSGSGCTFNPYVVLDCEPPKTYDDTKCVDSVPWSHYSTDT